MSPTLSIVIVNWNSKAYVDECLKSIAQHPSTLATEIIVVDGGSFDGIDKLLQENHPEVRFIQSPINLGFGRSNNLGIRESKGEIVALLNPDTTLRPGSLDLLVECLRDLPNAGAVGPRLLNADGTLQTSCVQAFPTPINQALDSDFLRKRFPRSSLWKTYAAFNESEPTEAEVLSGACIVVWRDLLVSIGGFSNEYFMYVEDMDLCRKIHEAGKIAYHVPRAEIIHFGGGSSSSQFSKFSVVMNLESLFIYMKIRKGPFHAALFRILMGISSSARLVGLALARLLGKPKRESSTRRWMASLRWSLGLERWTRQHQTRPEESPIVA